MALGKTNINLTEIPLRYEQIVNYKILYDGKLNSELGSMSLTYKPSSASFSVGSSSIQIASNNINYAAVATATNKVDTTGYNKIFYTGTGKRDSSSDNSNAQVGFGSTKSTSSGTAAAQADGGYVSFSVSKDITTTISKVALNTIKEGSYYFVIRCYNGTRNYNNIAMFKPDDWETLASKAGITATSIDDILTNSETLLANKNAVNFMVAQCTGDFMGSAMASEVFLTALNSSPYKSMVQANEHWAKFLAMVA